MRPRDDRERRRRRRRRREHHHSIVIVRRLARLRLLYSRRSTRVRAAAAVHPPRQLLDLRPELHDFALLVRLALDEPSAADARRRERSERRREREDR